jgi:hypothetical protein
MNRTPPSRIRRTLRQEVGFGCPVPGCGNPYLTWHHFDPPWHVRQHHDPHGMVALCLEHHAKADGGAFTDQQLREFKQSGTRSPVKGRFDWMRHNLLLLMGNNLFRSDTPLALKNSRLIWFTRDHQGYMLLNVEMPPALGEERVSMIDNFWIKRGNPVDLVCPPSGKLLKVEYSNGDRLNLEFLEFPTILGFHKDHPQFEIDRLRTIAKETEPITVVRIEYRVVGLNLEVRPDYLVCGPVILRSCVFNVRTGLFFNCDTKAWEQIRNDPLLQSGSKAARRLWNPQKQVTRQSQAKRTARRKPKRTRKNR